MKDSPRTLHARSSRALFTRTLSTPSRVRLAPGVSREVLAGARAQCTAAELTSGKQPGELSATCAAAISDLFTEVGEYNEYHWASPCGPDGQGNWGDGSAFACATGVLPQYLALAATQVALGVIDHGEKPLAWTQWDGDAYPF